LESLFSFWSALWNTIWFINELTQNHFKRMGSGECSLMADAFFSNLMGEYKRIAGICSNVGIATLVRARPELAEHEHLFFETIDKNDSDYKRVFDETHEKYTGKLMTAAESV